MAHLRRSLASDGGSALRRRDVLGGVAGAVAGAGLAPRTARGAWGEAPLGAAGDVLGPGVRAERCLELFLYGGVTAFESFYVAQDYGRADDPDPNLRNTQWHLFEDNHDRVYRELCGLGAGADEWLTPFAVDSNGVAVDLGPLVKPLWSRPDLLSRMRVVVMRHDIAPHEAAIPQAMSGLRLGNPRLAGFGAHVQRYWQDHEPRVVPYSYVFKPSIAADIYNPRSAVAAGLHVGSARPLMLQTSENMDLTALLGRPVVGPDAAKLDPLLRLYAGEPSTRYVDGTGAPLRARTLGDFEHGIESLIGAPALVDLMPNDLFATELASTCGMERADLSSMVLRAAAHLLRDPLSPARYVSAIDTGFSPFVDLGFDNHEEAVANQATNTTHALSALAAVINEPGEDDPTKIDLDDTLVIITTEFGRGPTRQVPESRGTNHWPDGYASVLLGGPVQGGLVGAIGPDAVATDYIGPAELRAAALAAMGIYPFTRESFAVGDLPLSGAVTEAVALGWLHQHVLGRS